MGEGEGLPTIFILLSSFSVFSVSSVVRLFL
jgi:hypothetical protein